MKYPSGIKKNTFKTTNYSNRGMFLEDEINVTNEQYISSSKAFIYKKPTPVTISKVEFNLKKEPIIKEAFFKTPSTTDYNGLYKGKYIDFEAKETALNSFPLSNIHSHQIVHLQNISKNGGIAFIIVRFTKLNFTFLLEEKYLSHFIKENKRKSIPLDYFESFGYKIKEKFNPRIDYLEIIENIYFKGEDYEKNNK